MIIANSRRVVILEPAAERVGHQLLRERRHEQLGPIQHGLAKADGAVERAAVGQPAGCVDRPARLTLRAPASDRVEVLRRQAHRIHQLMAARAHGVRAMLNHPLAHRENLRARAVLGQRRHVQRRGRHGRAEQILENPLAAAHRRRPVRVRRDRHDAALTEQPAAHVVRAELDAPEVAAVHVGNAVVLREALVEERVIGAQQIEHAAILLHDALEQHFGLATERLTKVVVEVGKQPRVGLACCRDCADTATARRSCSPALRRAHRPACGAPAAPAPRDPSGGP